MRHTEFQPHSGRHRPAGIKGSLLRARVDAIKRPVFDEPEEGKWPGTPPAHEEGDQGTDVHGSYK